MNSPSWSKVLLRKTGAVSRMKSFQNWPGSSGSAGGGASRIVRSSKPLRLERPGEGLLDDEHDPMAAPAQHVADADAVVRRTEGALRKEDDRPGSGVQRPNGLKGFGLVEKSTPFVSR